MDWKEILVILIPLVAMLGWVYNRIDKRFDNVLNELKQISQRK